MKRSLVVLLIFTLSISITLSGCIFQGDPTVATLNNGGNPTATNSYIGDENHMYIWWDSNPDAKSMIDTAIDEFGELNPEYAQKVIEAYTPAAQDRNALEISIAGGSAPALVKMDHVYVSTLCAKGDIENLLDSKYNFGQYENKFISSTWKAVQYKDKVFGIPFDAYTIALMYSKELLNEVNAQVPTTYDQFVNVSKAIKELGRDDVYGGAYYHGGAYQSDYTLIQMLLGMGGDIINEDYTEATINQQYGIDAFTMLSEGIESDYILLTRASNEAKLKEGKIAILNAGQWLIPEAEQDENVGFAPALTYKEGVPNYSTLGLNTLAVVSESAGNKNTDLAYDFALYLATNPKYSTKYCKAVNGIPALIEASEEPFFNDTNYGVFLEQLKNAKPRPNVDCWPGIEEAIYMAVSEVLNDNRPVKDALDSAANRINQLLDEENNPESTTKKNE